MADEKYFVYATKDYDHYFNVYTKAQLLEKLNSGFYKSLIEENSITIIRGVEVKLKAVEVVERWEVE